MTQRTVGLPEILASIDRETAATKARYKAALTAAAERLQRVREAGEQRGGQAGGVMVDEAPPELAEIAPDAAVTLHQLETRLDQLKEMRGWIKIDPELAGFITALAGGEGMSTGGERARAAAGRRESSDVLDRPRVLLAAVVAIVALAAGWLASALVPASALLHFGAR